MIQDSRLPTLRVVDLFRPESPAPTAAALLLARPPGATSIRFEGRDWPVPVEVVVLQKAAHHRSPTPQRLRSGTPLFSVSSLLFFLHHGPRPRSRRCGGTS